jgi:6-pyruvoyltetrahydropterin/6-carboxytetrahydropterin synthase
MVIDFSELKEIVNQELGGLDHSFLNQVNLSNFPNEMPTAENMVLWIRNRLQNRWDGMRTEGDISFIRLYETPTSYAEWRKE